MAFAAILFGNKAFAQHNAGDSLKGNFLPYIWVEPYHYSVDYQFNDNLNRQSIANASLEQKSVFGQKKPSQKWGYNPAFSYQENLPGTIMMTAINRFANREERKLKKILKEEAAVSKRPN